MAKHHGKFVIWAFLCAIFSARGHKLELVETFRTARRTYRRVSDDRFELERFEQVETRLFRCHSCGQERYEPAPPKPVLVTDKPAYDKPI